MIYDLIVIGGGPAGISTSIYAGRAKLKTLVIEKENTGGQIKITHELANYPGIINTTGSSYMETLKKQASNFNVKFKEDEVLDLNLEGEVKVIKTKNEELQARAVVLATGASPRKLGFKGESEFAGRGVAYCATCDGEFFYGLEVFVIGGGFAAAEEAMFLTKFAKKVKVIVREDDFTCAKTIADKVKAHPKIEVTFNTELLEVGGEGVLQFAKFKNNKTNETFEYHANKEDGTFGVFVFVGYKPQTDLFKNKVELDNYGYVITNDDMETNVKGVYAAGDLRPKSLRQVVTAVADGAIAAVSCEKYVYDLKEKLGIIDEEDFEENDNKEEETTSNVNSADGEFKSKLLNESLRAQISQILSMMQNEVTLVSVVDESNEKSLEFRDLILDMSLLGEKLNVEIYKKSENKEIENKINADKFPVVALLDKNKEYSGVKFHGVPGGHELNSFILSIYNLAGPGQKLDDNVLEKIKSFDKNVNLKVVVSLSCTLCPDVVVSSQRLAIENKNIETEMIDLSLFRDIKEKHKIMSVPAIIVNDEEVHFGSKKINEILDLINKN